MVLSALMKRFRNKAKEQVPPSKEGLLDAEVLGKSPTTDFYTQHSWRRKYLPGLASIAIGLTSLGVGRSIASDTLESAFQNRLTSALTMANVHRRTEGIYNSGMALADFFHSRGLSFSCPSIGTDLNNYFETHKRSGGLLYVVLEPIIPRPISRPSSEPIQPTEIPAAEATRFAITPFCGDNSTVKAEDQVAYRTFSDNLGAAMARPVTLPNRESAVNPDEINYAIWQANRDYNDSPLGSPLEVFATTLGGFGVAYGALNIAQEQTRARIIEQDIARMAASINELP